MTKMNTLSPKCSYDLVISDALWHIRCNINHPDTLYAILLRHACARQHVRASACTCIGGLGVSNRTMSVCGSCGCNVQYAKGLFAAVFSIKVAGGLVHRDILAYVLCIWNACSCSLGPSELH